MASDFLTAIKKNEGIIFRLVRIYADQHEDQQDLYQEIVYQLWKSYHSFQGKSKVSTWIYKVALNTALAHLNLKKKHAGKAAIQDIDILFEDPDGEFADTVEEMYKQIRELNEVDRAIIFLFLEGKNHEEIAVITGFSVSNVGTRISRIKQKLKNQVTK